METCDRWDPQRQQQLPLNALKQIKTSEKKIKLKQAFQRSASMNAEVFKVNINNTKRLVLMRVNESTSIVVYCQRQCEKNMP